MEFDDVDELAFVDGGPEDMIPGPADFAAPAGPPPRAIQTQSRHPEQGARPQLEVVDDMMFVDTAGEPPVPGGPPEHHSMRVRQPTVDVYGPGPGARPPSPHGPPPRPMPGPGGPPPPYHSQAIGATPGHPPPQRAMGQSGGGNGMLGLSLLTLTLGTAIGAKYKGIAGAAAGGLAAGGAMNLLRASQQYMRGTPQADKEGRVSATYGVIGAAGAGLIAYRYIFDQGKRGGDPDAFKPNPEDDVDDGNDCDIRPVGP